MAKDLKVEMVCPECDAILTEDDEKCPICGIEIDWIPEDETSTLGVDEMLDDILTSSLKTRQEQASSEDGNDAPLKDAEPENEIEEDMDGGSEAEEDMEEESKVEEVGITEIMEEGGSMDEDAEEEVSDEDEDESDKEHRIRDGEGETTGGEDLSADLASDSSGPPQRRAKTLSSIGMVSTALACLSLVGLVILLNWDTWVKGDASGSIGERQILAIYSATIFMILMVLLSVGDVYRNKRASRT